MPTSDFKTSLRANSWPFCQEVLGEAKGKNCNCLRALARVLQFYRSELRTPQNGQTGEKRDFEMASRVSSSFFEGFQKMSRGFFGLKQL